MPLWTLERGGLLLKTRPYSVQLLVSEPWAGSGLSPPSAIPLCSELPAQAHVTATHAAMWRTEGRDPPRFRNSPDRSLWLAPLATSKPRAFSSLPIHPWVSALVFFSLPCDSPVWTSSGLWRPRSRPPKEMSTLRRVLAYGAQKPLSQCGRTPERGTLIFKTLGSCQYQTVMDASKLLLSSSSSSCGFTPKRHSSASPSPVLILGNEPFPLPLAHTRPSSGYRTLLTRSSWFTLYLFNPQGVLEIQFRLGIYLWYWKEGPPQCYDVWFMSG